MGRIIAIISGKDGVGKTTVAATLSSALAALNKKTLCLYFTTGSNQIKVALGITDSVYARSIDVLNGQEGVVKACTKHSGIPNLYVLTLSYYTESGMFNSSDVKPMFSEIRKNFDYCIIDTPSISDSCISPALADVDMSIIVTTCDTPANSDVLIAERYSRESGISDLRLLINRILPENNEQIKITADNICSMINAKLKGLIPNDELITQNPLSKNPKILDRKRIFKSRFLSIARGIIGEEAALEEQMSALPPQSPTKPSQIPPSSTTASLTPPKKPMLKPLLKPPPKPMLKPLSMPPLPQSLLQTYERPQTSESDVIPFEIPSNYLGKYGDPSHWAQSTLKHANTEDLVAIYSIQSNQLTGRDTIRDRMWLHDLLDDKMIPYYIEVGSKDGTKDLAEAQFIYVEKHNAKKVIFYIRQFNDPGSIIRDDMSKESLSNHSDYGVPQKKCQTCGKDIDFDHYKCPYCKEKAEA